MRFEKKNIFTFFLAIVLILLLSGTVSAEGNFSWTGTVALEEGPDIEYSSTNNPGVVYDVSPVSDLVALKEASESGGFDFYTDDGWYSQYGTFTLDGINSINTTDDWSYYWAIYINGIEAPTGLGGNILSDGDLLQFCYGYSDFVETFPTPDSCDNLVSITVNKENFGWTGTVALSDGPDIEYSSTNNPSEVHDVSSVSDLAALDAASESGSFGFYTDDSWYSQYGTFNLDGINGINTTDDWSYYWAIYINGNEAPGGLGGNILDDGDLLQFCYGYSDFVETFPTPDSCDNLVSITVNKENFEWSGSISLSYGPDIEYSPTNHPSAVYDVISISDLAALDAASDSGGFDFYTDDGWYSQYGTFTLDGIEDVYNTGDWSYYWAIYINGNEAPSGLGGNILADGDLLQFCYGPYESDSPTPDNCINLVNISVEKDDFEWTGTVTLSDGPDFEYSPTSDPGVVYEISPVSDLAALDAASESGSFGFYTDDSWYSQFGCFLIDGIADVNNTADQSWFIYINGDQAPGGLGNNILSDGDLLQFCYGSYNYTTSIFPTPDSCDDFVSITVDKENFGWTGTVTLSDGPDYEYSPTNNDSAVYDVSRISDLAALNAASESGGFEFYTDDSWYSTYGTFTLDGINGINTTDDWSYYWAIYINGNEAPTGLGGNILDDGDLLQFCYGYSNYGEGISPTPDSCDNLVSITVNKENFGWTGTVTLSDGPDFEYSPTNDPSAVYEVSPISDLAALKAASESGNFDFYTDDGWYSTYGTFTLDGINGINTTDDWSYYWAMYINGDEAPMGFGGNILSDGDLLQFCYGYSSWSESIFPTPDSCDNLVSITVGKENFGWTGTVSLFDDAPAFEYSPTNDPSAVYDVSPISDLAALDAASESGNFDFYTDDGWYSTYGTFTLDGINGINTTDDWSYYWAIYINGQSAPEGLGGNILSDEDLLQFCYGPNDWGLSPTPGNCTNLISITVDEDNFCWSGTVTLSNGPDIEYSPTNDPGAVYNISPISDLAALDAASESGGFDFYTDDTWYSTYGTFTLDGINGINTTDDWSYYWAIYINGNEAPMGLGGNILSDGDLLQFCYGYYNYSAGISPTPGDCTNLVSITFDEDKFGWTGSVTLYEDSEFEYSPTIDPGAVYDVSPISDLAALDAASESGGFDFYTDDLWYSTYGTFWLDGIADINRTNDWSYCWYIYVNGNEAPAGLGGNILDDGDLLQFCYGYSNDTAVISPTPEDCINLVNISINVYEGAGPGSANIRWNTTPLSGDIDMTPVIADGKVFFSTFWSTVQKDTYYLYCFNQTDGTFIWKYAYPQGQGSYLSSAAIGGGNVYVRGTNGVMYAIDISDGSEVWTATLDESPLWWDHATSSPVVHEDNIYVMSQNAGILRKYDFAGNKLQSFNTGGELSYRSSPVVSAGNVYFAGGSSKKLYSIDCDSFNENWNFVSQENILSSPVVGLDTVYLTTASHLYALNRATGEERWQIEVSSPSGGGTPALSGGYLYVGETDGLYKYDALTGSEIWSYNSASIATSPAVEGGSVYFSTNEAAGKVVCLNTDDGSLLWSYAQTDPEGYYAAFWGSSPVIDDEMLYIGGAYYDTLYCFGPSMPLGEPHLHATPVGGKAPLNVHFSASGCEKANTFVLDFGDGSDAHVSNSLEGVSVSHVYQDANRYTAKLTISDSNTSRSVNYDINVIEPPSGDNADFVTNSSAPGVTVTDPDSRDQGINIDTTGWSVTGTTATYTQPDGTMVSVATTNTNIIDNTLIGNVTSVTVTTPQINSTEISPDVGSPSLAFNYTMENYQTGASVEAEISAGVADDARNAISVACEGSGLNCADIAYTMYFTKSGFKNESSLSGAVISFTVKTSWIDNHGGIDALKIIRWLDDGTTQTLTPDSFEIDGEYTRAFVTTDGFSVYAPVMTTVKSSGGGSSGGSGGSSLYYTPVSLSSGTFEVTAANNGEVYAVDRMTPFGILDASGHEYVVTYTDSMGIYVKSIDGIEPVDLSGWMYTVNGDVGGVGAAVCAIKNNDEVLWYYSESMSSDPESSAYKVALKAVISSTTSSGSGAVSINSELNGTSATGSSDEVTVDISIGLPAESSLTFEEGMMYFSIDLDAAKSAGEDIVQDKNTLIITRGDLVLTIKFVDYKVRTGITSGEIESISLSTAPVGSDLGVEGYLVMEMNGIPIDAHMVLSAANEVNAGDINSILERSGLGKEIDSVAFELSVDRENLEEGIDIAKTTVYMTAPDGWVSGNGGTEEVRIIQVMDDGNAVISVPEIRWSEDGEIIFSTTSEAGTSEFILATLSDAGSSATANAESASAPEATGTQAAGSSIIPLMGILAIACAAIIIRISWSE